MVTQCQVVARVVTLCSLHEMSEENFEQMMTHFLGGSQHDRHNQIHCSSHQELDVKNCLALIWIAFASNRFFFPVTSLFV